MIRYGVDNVPCFVALDECGRAVLRTARPGSPEAAERTLAGVVEAARGKGKRRGKGGAAGTVA